jgi:hypothetical protein
MDFIRDLFTSSDLLNTQNLYVLAAMAAVIGVYCSWMNSTRISR